MTGIKISYFINRTTKERLFLERTARACRSGCHSCHRGNWAAYPNGGCSQLLITKSVINVFDRHCFGSR